ncbi:hypothetical protein CC86DRAFT_404770 [Ophiobolus disseminans]|uniref:Uncharacterized protein n=1 Tax=Ophiobolus disseminans TaxID=1469910 RepID=A0A6A7A834_9PLEO|nr:hypothetical protein CC86DRAFT_404770 [Ophiobolus disseminans]
MGFAKLQLSDPIAQPTSSRPAPFRPLQDYRCFDCRALDPPNKPPKYFLETCPHKPDLSPSPNPFEILTGLAQSPTEPRWAFDFVPTKAAGTKRRGRRGGKRHKAKCTVPKECEEQKSDSFSDFCKRLIALRIQSRDSTSDNDELLPKPADNITIPPATFSPMSVRHHWAPQFRPNSLLPPSPPPMEQNTSYRPNSLLDPSPSTLNQIDSAIHNDLPPFANLALPQTWDQSVLCEDKIHLSTTPSQIQNKSPPSPLSHLTLIDTSTQTPPPSAPPTPRSELEDLWQSNWIDQLDRVLTPPASPAPSDDECIEYTEQRNVSERVLTPPARSDVGEDEWIADMESLDENEDDGWGSWEDWDVDGWEDEGVWE